MKYLLYVLDEFYSKFVIVFNTLGTQEIIEIIKT